MNRPMRDVEVRSLDAAEIKLSRDIVGRYPDFHMCYLVERLPRFFGMGRMLDPDARYFQRQRLALGAFVAGAMIGTVAVEPVSNSLPTPTEYDEERFFAMFSEQETVVYHTLLESFNKTFIGAPLGALTVHSLAVMPEYRQLGIARSLVRFAVNHLSAEERSALYIEFARLKWLVKFGASVGFAKVRQTFSLSERLEYGCWGSVLMRYQPDNGR